MSKHRKQQVDVRALEHIPAVREALRFVGLELLIRPLSYVVAPALKAADIQKASEQQIQRAEVVANQVQAEWLRQQVDVEEALVAERAMTAPKPAPHTPKPLAQLPAAQRRAVEQGFLQEVAARRTEKLSQFKRDGGGKDEEVVVATEELTNLAEAT